MFIGTSAIRAIKDIIKVPRFIECHRLGPYDARMADMEAQALGLGMAVLVEVHDAAELEEQLLAGFEGAEPISNDALLTLECDVLVPAALGGVMSGGVISAAASCVRSIPTFGTGFVLGSEPAPLSSR